MQQNASPVQQNASPMLQNTDPSATECYCDAADAQYLLVTAVRMKKPIFISMEGGKVKTPLWIMGMIPHNYIYDSIEEIMEMIKQIDSGEKKIDSDRWRLLRRDLR